jgi:16S rRNA (guanine966-N2)-methyltransferase
MNRSSRASHGARYSDGASAPPGAGGSARAPHGVPAATRHAPHQIRIIGGDWKRTPLPVLDLEGLRPTPDRVRETLFNWLGQRLDGLTCLDLFAGTGALGLEAASRGAKRVLMIERNPRAAKQLRAVQDKLDARTVEIVEADAMRIAAGLAPGAFDVVFLDPPFGGDLLPGALNLVLPLVAPDGAVYVESGEPLERIFAAQAAGGAFATPGWPLLDGWSLVRHDRAGAVHYHLLRRENGE